MDLPLGDVLLELRERGEGSLPLKPPTPSPAHRWPAGSPRRSGSRSRPHPGVGGGVAPQQCDHLRARRGSVDQPAMPPTRPPRDCPDPAGSRLPDAARPAGPRPEPRRDCRSPPARPARSRPPLQARPRDGAGVRGRRRVDGVRRRPGQAAAERGPRDRRPPAPAAYEHEQPDGREQPGDQHRPAQPRQEVGAAEQLEGPPARSPRPPRRRPAKPGRRPAAATAPPRHPDQRADRRGQRDGVVGVEDARHEAEHQAVISSQPPQRTSPARARSVRAARAA